MVCDDFFQQLVTSHKKQEQSGDSLRKYCDEIVHAITIDKSPIVLLNSDGKPSAVRSDSEVYSEDGLFLSLRSSLQNLQYSHALLLTSIGECCSVYRESLDLQ